MARSFNDWAALKKAELEGREPPGTYERLRQEDADARAFADKKRLEDDFDKVRKLHAEATGRRK